MARVAWVSGHLFWFLPVRGQSVAPPSPTVGQYMNQPRGRYILHFDFFAAAALAFAAFFLLLLIMTMPRNEPTTAEPNRVNITGMRIAHTRGGKRL